MNINEQTVSRNLKEELSQQQNEDFCKLLPFPGLMNRYLKHWLFTDRNALLQYYADDRNHHEQSSQDYVLCDPFYSPVVNQLQTSSEKQWIALGFA